MFDSYEDDGIYLIPRHFVIPPYMFDERYLDYHIDDDQDVVVDQSKTQCEKLARILRRARRYQLFEYFLVIFYFRIPIFL